MPIEFLRSEKDPEKKVPAQRIRTVYQKVGVSARKIDLPPDIYVSHFETCTKARQFSKKGKP